MLFEQNLMFYNMLLYDYDDNLDKVFIKMQKVKISDYSIDSFVWTDFAAAIGVAIRVIRQVKLVIPNTNTELDNPHLVFMPSIKSELKTTPSETVPTNSGPPFPSYLEDS